MLDRYVRKKESFEINQLSTVLLDSCFKCCRICTLDLAQLLPIFYYLKSGHALNPKLGRSFIAIVHITLDKDCVPVNRCKFLKFWGNFLARSAPRGSEINYYCLALVFTLLFYLTPVAIVIHFYYFACASLPKSTIGTIRALAVILTAYYFLSGCTTIAILLIKRWKGPLQPFPKWKPKIVEERYEGLVRDAYWTNTDTAHSGYAICRTSWKEP